MSDASSGLVAIVVVATSQIVAVGRGLVAPDDPAYEVRDVLDSEAEKFHEPGDKFHNPDGTVTVTPPPPAPYSFAAAEDTERLRLVNERAATDPAFAALAELSLKGWTR